MDYTCEVSGKGRDMEFQYPMIQAMDHDFPVRLRLFQGLVKTLFSSKIS